MSSFWTPTAIVSLCVSQAATEAARKLLREESATDRIVVWWGTQLEVEAAFARLLREQVLNEKAYEQAQRLLEQLRKAWVEVNPTDKVREVAMGLPRKHGLSPLEAEQLAAALVWTNEKPRARSFVSLSKRLSDAAEAEGFTVFDLSGT